MARQHTIGGAAQTTLRLGGAAIARLVVSRWQQRGKPIGDAIHERGIVRPTGLKLQL
jgi:hypothetical protein